jgi:hypothetical protein
MSLLPPLAVSVTVPAPVADIAPLTVIEPVFVTVILPPLTLLVMPVMVRAATSVSEMFPLLVFVALNPVTALLPLVSVVPPTELVVSVEPRIPPDCVSAPPAVNVTALVVCAAALLVSTPALAQNLWISGGPIYTGVAERPTAEAVIVQGGKITFVGDPKTIRFKLDPTTETIDLKGAALFPGPAIALLGTNLSREVATEIARLNEHVYVALDPDAIGKAQAMVERLRAAGAQSYVQPITNDVKNMTVRERMELFRSMT